MLDKLDFCGPSSIGNDNSLPVCGHDPERLLYCCTGKTKRTGRTENRTAARTEKITIPRTENHNLQARIHFKCSTDFQPISSKNNWSDLEARLPGAH